MAFVGRVQDAFEIAGKGTVLMVLLESGEPVQGEAIETLFGSGLILALDPVGVRTRSCLTGQTVPPHIMFLTDLPKPEGKSYRLTCVSSVESKGNRSHV